METTEFYRIVDEYKAQNNIVNITDEEITDLFGESFLFPNYYQSAFEIDSDYTIIITDYESYLLEKGINIIEPTPRNEKQKKLADEYYADMMLDKYGVGIGFNDCLQEGECEYELEGEINQNEH